MSRPHPSIFVSFLPPPSLNGLFIFSFWWELMADWARRSSSDSSLLSLSFFVRLLCKLSLSHPSSSC